MISPCMGCERREIGCHAKCTDYAEFHEGRVKAIKDRAYAQHVDSYRNHVIARIYENKRKGR